LLSKVDKLAGTEVQLSRPAGIGYYTAAICHADKSLALRELPGFRKNDKNGVEICPINIMPKRCRLASC